VEKWRRGSAGVPRLPSGPRVGPLASATRGLLCTTRHVSLARLPRLAYLVIQMIGRVVSVASLLPASERHSQWHTNTLPPASPQ
jgi:hypothetical protein